MYFYNTIIIVIFVLYTFIWYNNIFKNIPLFLYIIIVIIKIILGNYYNVQLFKRLFIQLFYYIIYI